MPLEEYRRKRHFGTTPEPSGDAAPKRAGKGGPGARGGKGLLYVIQKHEATRLHWDFRIEVEGVLASWAVPKGPSFDPAEKRLAMHVEDHPIEYGTFEGTIPEGEYGAGTVMLWDQGAWEPYEGDEKDAAAQLDKGVLKMVLHGERLQGRWVLVRTHGYGDRDSWLLIKEHDENERPHAEFDATAEWMTSVKTGRTMEQIALGDEQWHSDKPAASGSGPSARREIAEAVRSAARKSAGATAAAPANDAKATATLERQAPAAVPTPADVAGARKAALPRSQDVELATLVKAPPEGERWVHEVKFDGYRMLARVADGKASLISRNGKDWTDRFGQVARGVERLVRDRPAMLDGEVVVLRPNGASDFQLLQNFVKRGSDDDLYYYVFDLLHLDGWDLRSASLEERKRLLVGLFGQERDGTVRYSEHLSGSGRLFWQSACEQKLEGIVSKRLDAPYRTGRQKDWLKSKCMLEQEFVVVGWTDPGGSRSAFGALVLGAYDKGELRHFGRVGTGFTDASLAEILERLTPLERERPPVVDPPKGAAARGIHWAEPKLVAEVSFIEWTKEDQLRHPSFHGLRDDKPTKEVVVERPQPIDVSAAEPDATPVSGQEPALAHGGAVASARAHAPARSSSRRERLLVDGVGVTNPDRVLWPDIGVTKLEAMRYYESVADLMLPHVVDRPLSLVRCPEGFTGECFFQKHIENFPDTVATVDIYEPEEKRAVPYARITGIGSVIGLMQMGVLEIHPWGSKADEPDRPDRLVFDLDPDEGMGFEQVAGTALLVRSELGRLGLESWLKTTGGKGLHVVVPIRRAGDWGDVRDFTRAFVDSVVDLAPSLFTANMSKAQRGGKVFIDYVRNTRGATAIAPYSTRARPGATVSVPLHWEELDGADAMPTWSVRTLSDRIGAKGFSDPWAGMTKARQGITKQMRKHLGLG